MNNPIKVIRYNQKTIRPEDLPPEAWTVLDGRGENSEAQDYYSKVSWVFRSVRIIMNASKMIPFVIEDLTGNKVDDSNSYENAVGFMPFPDDMIALFAAALTVFGYAYGYKRPNALRTKTYELRYLLPTSVKPEWLKDASGRVIGLAGFRRTGVTDLIPVEDMVYFWDLDPFVETSTPQSSPLMAASAAAGVVLNLDKFAALFFARGAIKATLLAVSGSPPPGEKERIKSLWARLFKGIANVFGEMVIEADALKPIVVGEGLESLADKNLSNEKREAIASAIGIPYSLLFSSSAKGLGGGGVAEQDEINLYKETVIPLVKFIVSRLNEQLFKPAGYKMRITPETMDMFQIDETTRATSISTFLDAIGKATDYNLFQAVCMIFGYEIPDEALKMIEAYYKAKSERAATLTDQLAQGGNKPPEPNAPPAPDQNPPQDKQPPQQKRTDLDRWRDKVVKAVKAGKPATVAFESYEIPPAIHGAISGALETVKSVDDVHGIFADVWMGYP